jgi:hypothetical protein
VSSCWPANHKRKQYSINLDDYSPIGIFWRHSLTEAYSANRFFAVTGQELSDTGVEARQSAFDEFVAAHLGSRQPSPATSCKDWICHCSGKPPQNSCNSRLGGTS